LNAIEAAYQRGAVIAGVAGAIQALGHYVFTAANGTITSAEALANPYDTRVTLERDFIHLPVFGQVLVDGHFQERDRFGRVLTFMARVIQDGWATNVRGIGVNENTALGLGPDGIAQVFGTGRVYVIDGSPMPAVCATGMPLTDGPISYLTLSAGERVSLANPGSGARPRTVSANAGVLDPASPY
jgi:cyanophycinase-like exopeptidase